MRNNQAFFLRPHTFLDFSGIRIAVMNILNSTYPNSNETGIILLWKKVQSPYKSITIIPAIPALPVIPLFGVE